MRVVAGWLCIALVYAGECAGQNYEPLFQKSESALHTEVGKQYLLALSSTTIQEAIRRWENFIAGNKAATQSSSFEDATHLDLVRSAHYELVRLYYMSGRFKSADELLVIANGLIAYEAPSPDEARAWCEKHRYCTSK